MAGSQLRGDTDKEEVSHGAGVKESGGFILIAVGSHQTALKEE